MNKHTWREVCRSNAFFCSIAFSLGLALVVRSVTNRWSSQARLQTRVVLFTLVREILEEWEEPCLREVEKWVVSITTTRSSSISGLGEPQVDLLFETHNKIGDRIGDIAPFHGAVRSMAYAPTVDLKQWLRLWRMGRYLCASLVEDMLLIERLGYLIKYVAFRRLALMSEARYYAAAWRSAAYGGNLARAGLHVPTPRIPLWLVGRRPFWAIPLSDMETEQFLYLPLSYFPVEAILTSSAEETWIKEIVNILPLLTERITVRYLPDILRVRRTLHLVRSLIQWKYPMSWRRLWNEIDRLFFQYGVKLANEQLQRREKACQRFYQEKLFKGVEMVSGEGPDMEEGENEGSFCTLNTRTTLIAGRDILLRDASVTRRLQILLHLRSLSHTVRAVIGLLAPQYNFFAEWLLFVTLSSAEGATGREKVLIEFLHHVLRSSFASTIGALMRFLDDIVKAKICSVLRHELAYELSVKLAIADEAFLRRCMEEGVAGRDDPVKNSSTYAENMASQILSRFDCEERKRMARFVVFFLSVWRQELDVALFAAVISLLDYHEIAHALCCWLGITVERELDHELARLEKGTSPPECPRYGLRLMMEVLVEEKKKEDARQYRGLKKIPHPHLALVVCGGTFLLDWWLPVRAPSNNNNDSTLSCYFKHIENFLDNVIHCNDYCCIGNRAPATLQGACLNPLVDGLKQNAAYVKEFVLKRAVKFSKADKNNIVEQNSGGIKLIGRKTEFTLHTEEVDLLRHHQAMSHIPRALSFEDVFEKQPRFIFRQLGLETVFAYQAAMMFQQSGCLSIMESLMDFVSSPYHNVFAQTCVRLMEFIERVLFYALFGYRVKSYWNVWSSLRRFIAVTGCSVGGVEKDLSIVALSGWEAVSLLGRMGSYRAALRDYGDCSFGPPFRLALQLARYLPTTLHDASPIHYSPLVEERRRAWMTAIRGRGKLEWDNIGRIVGGFSLTKGISFSGVYFAYPQLHHSVEGGSLQPTLSDITAEFPAGQMTALVGPTGSGKSTIMNLLKRMYDPLPVVRINKERDSWAGSEELINTLRCCLCASLPMPMEDSYRNTIFLDDIPVGCFSTSYLRGLFAILEQSPYVSERLTFLQNIFLFDPGLSTEEAVAATRLCRCEEFIESRPLAHDALTGSLSAGERHRLALARAVAVSRNGSGVLLLDEPTARLDGYNGCLVEEALGMLLGPPRGMTIVIISHRLSTLRSATYAVVLESGKVERCGPFQELVESSPYFQHLVAAQGLNTRL